MIEDINTLPSAWIGHRPFAEWLVQRMYPDTIVDLGVDHGFSTFCFANPKIGHVYGIDSFEGDNHSGPKDAQSLQHFVKQNKINLGYDNITFIRGYFDEIAKVWNKPIDILHIDGFHAYESVKNDYETWSPFVRDGGVILFHDTMVYGGGFGVMQLFSEIELPKVNFTFWYGLGVVSRNEMLIQEIYQKFQL